MKLDRLNIIILVLFPVFALGAIKVTNSILPPQFYFSISKLAKGADEPFIVEPPSVTEEKFCDLLKKHRVNSANVNLPSVDCGRIYAAPPKPQPTSYVPSPEEKDQIYRIAFQADQGARETLIQDTRAVQIPVLSDQELDDVLSRASSPLNAFDAIMRHYSLPYDNMKWSEDSRIRSYLGNAFQQIVAAHASEQQSSGYVDSSGYKPSDLKPEEIRRIKDAHQRFAASLSGVDFGRHYKAISVDDIERIVKGLYSADSVPRDFASFYVEQNEPIVKAALRSEFEASNIDLSDSAELRKQILSEASQTGIFSYIIAALARVVPIFVIALIFGAYFGRREVFSISIGAGVLAFLLVWPILLLWDTVVQSQWADYKALFIGMYALYMLAFYAVARSGGLIGAALSRSVGLRQALDEHGGAVDTSGRIQVREILISLISSGIFSFFAFSLNLIIPLQA